MLITESLINDDSMLSIILVSGGLVSLVVTILGIKLRWFRHRLTFDEVVNESIDSNGSRASCSRGMYRQTFDDDNLTTPVVVPQKQQTNNRESIFRWPFRSKLQFTNKSVKEDSGHISTLQSVVVSSHEHDHNVELREKNAKLKKMINQRISSQNYAVINKLETKQYRELSVDRDESEVVVPLPLKRKSLEVTKESPPVVKPRTIMVEKVVEAVVVCPDLTVTIEDPELIEGPPVFEKVLPKSILKNTETNTVTKKIQFQEIVTTSDSDDSDDSEDSSDDSWNLVDEHRSHLNRNQPPPLPKTPPPSLDSTA